MVLSLLAVLWNFQVWLISLDENRAHWKVERCCWTEDERDSSTRPFTACTGSKLYGRNLKRVVETIMGLCHRQKGVQRMDKFANETNCRKCGKHNEKAEHLLFDCEGLGQVRCVW